MLTLYLPLEYLHFKRIKSIFCLDYDILLLIQYVLVNLN